MGRGAERIQRLLNEISDARAKQLIEEKQKLKTETPMIDEDWEQNKKETKMTKGWAAARIERLLKKIDDDRAKQLIEESAESLNQKNAWTLGRRKFEEDATAHIESYRAHEEKYILKAIESLLSEAIEKEDIRLVVIAREALKALRQKPKTDLNFSDVWDTELVAVDWTK